MAHDDWGDGSGGIIGSGDGEMSAPSQSDMKAKGQRRIEPVHRPDWGSGGFDRNLGYEGKSLPSAGELAERHPPRGHTTRPDWNVGSDDYDDDLADDDDGDLPEPLRSNPRASMDGEPLRIPVPQRYRDDPVASEFAARMKESGYSDQDVSEALWAMGGVEDQVEAELRELDALAEAEATSILRKHWDSDLEANLAGINEFLHSAPPGVADAITNARLGSGVPLGSDPQFLTWLSNIIKRGR